MYKKYVKRILDIICSLLLIIILFPIMLLTSIVTLIHIGRPLLDMRLPREGKDKKPFYMYKIRTRIYDVKDYWGRKTKLTNLIDNLRLNELVQLFNVLKGDMSIVGPRPFIAGEKLPEQKIDEKRYKLRPGITGLSQVVGGRELSHKKKLEYDIIYYDNLSFLLDLAIILVTPIALIKQNIEIYKK